MTVLLTRGKFRVEVVPDFGGGLTRFDVLQPNGWQAVLRAAPDKPFDPDQLALYPLCPWSNRLGLGGITDSNGQWQAFPLNRKGERYPLHGDGWQSAWEISSQDLHHVELSLCSRNWPGLEYDAKLNYALVESGLSVQLQLTNRAGETRWFGGGLHPWFDRDLDTTLQFSAGGVWEAGADLLPTRLVSPKHVHDFSTPSAFPAFTLDHCYEGWHGPLHIHWPARGLHLTLTVTPGIHHCIVYAPADKNFFCAEPVSHRNNAHSELIEGRPHGLVRLHAGESWEATFLFDVEAH